MWEIATGEMVTELAMRDAILGSVAFDEPGQRIITRTAFDSAGQRVVTASHDGTARVWNAATGEQLAALVGHEVLDEGEIRAASFSPDGSRIVTASADRTARLWTPDGKAVATGAELARFGGQDEYVETVAFSPDGTRLLTSAGYTPRLYDLRWLTRQGGAALATAVCREKLRGIGRITEEDGIALGGLSARAGEDVCGVT